MDQGECVFKEVTKELTLLKAIGEKGKVKDTIALDCRQKGKT